MSDHASIRELLSLAAAGVLAPHDQRLVDEHVAACEACRLELVQWQLCARELARLPAPVASENLAERTRARILAERAAKAERRWDDVVLAVLALFAWTVSLVTWVVFRLFSGGMISVFQAGFLTILIWSGATTVLAWLTAAVAAVMLGSRRKAVRRLV